MDWSDIIISVAYFILISGICFHIRHKITTPCTKKYFFPAYIIKMGGSLTFVLVYTFYFKEGDTFLYFKSASVLWDVFLKDPIIALKLLISDANVHVLESSVYTLKIPFFSSSPEWTITRITAMVGLFTFNSFTAISFVFGFYCFLGTWFFFRVFSKYYPEFSSYLFVCILCVPSCLFWASGLLKDTICLGSLGFLIYYVDKWLSQPRKILFIFIAVFMALLIYFIKSYLILSFLPSLILWVYLKVQKEVKSVFFNGVFKLFILFSFLGILIFLPNLIDEIQKHSEFQSAIYKLKGYHQDPGREESSSYSLDVDKYAINDLFLKIPASLNVTLFRPYLWEAKNLPAVLSAIESTIILLLSIWVLLKVGLLNFFNIVISDRQLLFSLSFVLLAGFIVGITSSNFGLLARLKTPLLPFYLSSIIIIYFTHQKTKRKI